MPNESHEVNSHNPDHGTETQGTETPVSGPVAPTTSQPGTDPVRPVNPDVHGVPGATHETEASRLEREAKTSRENRY